MSGLTDDVFVVTINHQYSLCCPGVAWNQLSNIKHQIFDKNSRIFEVEWMALSQQNLRDRFEGPSEIRYVFNSFECYLINKALNWMLFQQFSETVIGGISILNEVLMRLWLEPVMFLLFLADKCVGATMVMRRSVIMILW